MRQKIDLINATSADTSDFAEKNDLASLKADADKQILMNLEKLVNNISIFEIEIDRLDICIKEFIPAQLIQLIDAVNKK